ncbi:Na/Pi symporter [Alicyclobacillus tolerans]|uniref:Na/Pi cotransporter family protein n=1 Tax=Alicyclobacillus tolerans TaxID=90970 RepID=UPI001EFF9092|nr:Na/Pi symporter [Alicyclobacillus tolerans]MCF8563332.1 Na/Pi symporter [Alicyclobacillus tolerans]
MWVNAIAAALSLVAFLGGLKVMRDGLTGLGEGRLPGILRRFVQTPTRGIATGIVSTALMQSSAAITAITVGMVASGSMVFRDALGVVLGSNVGSTLMPLILTLNLWGIVIPSLVLGTAGFATRRPQLRFPSMAMVGFASIFIGLQALTVSLHPMTQMPWFSSLIQSAGQHPLYAVVTGILASAAIQSSTATTVITMALATDGVIPLSGAIAIVLGANVGTCVTSVIAAIGQPRPAQQVALSHVLLNVSGVALALPLLGPYSHLMVWLTPAISQQVANAHTLFNALCTLLVWPVTGSFARLVERILPDKQCA